MTSRRSHVPKTSIGYCDNVTPPYVKELATSCVSTVQNDSDDVMTQIAPKMTAPLEDRDGIERDLARRPRDVDAAEHDHDDDQRLDEPSTRRGANSDAQSCRSAPAGRSRNRSNVPALMWREASSTSLTKRSASPKPVPASP